MTYQSPQPGAEKQLGELEFLARYCDSALRKPQLVADAILRTVVTAPSHERALLCAALAAELGEACRLLAHVFAALEDRTHPVATVLAGPLPPADAWEEFARLLATVPLEALTRRMFIDSSAAECAERLQGSANFELIGQVVRAHTNGRPLLVKPQRDTRRPPDTFTYGELTFGTQESDASLLADLVADACEAARGFLGSYVESRQGWTI